MADSSVPSSGSIRRSQDRKRCAAVEQKQDKEFENDKGFRFTRQSKRIRQKNEAKAGLKSSACVTQNGGPNGVDAEKKTKRRRSSFIPGRKIQSPLDICKSEKLTTVEGLFKQIPTDLSQNERLLQLFDKSVLLMCKNATDEKYSNIPNFCQEVEEMVLHLRTTLKDSEFAKQAGKQKTKVDERIIVPNPKAQQFEDYAKKSQETSERMVKEDKAWEEILEKYQKDIAEIESEVNLSQDSKIDNLTDYCSQEQQDFLDSIQPSKDILEKVDRLKEESILMIDQIVTTASTVKALSEAADRYLEKNAKDLIESPTSFGMCETPRHLIQAITKDSQNLH